MVIIFTLETLKKIYEEYSYVTLYLIAYVFMNVCEVISPILGLLFDSFIYLEEKKILYENLNDMKTFYYPMDSRKLVALIEKLPFMVIIQNFWCVGVNIYNGTIWNSKLYHLLHFIKQMVTELMLIQITFEISLTIYYLRTFSEVLRNYKNCILNDKLSFCKIDVEETNIFLNIVNVKNHIKMDQLQLNKINNLYAKMIENCIIINKRFHAMVRIDIMVHL